VKALIAVSIPAKTRIARIAYRKVPAIAVPIARQAVVAVLPIRENHRSITAAHRQARNLPILTMRRITMIRKISITITMMISMSMMMRKSIGMRIMNESRNIGMIPNGEKRKIKKHILWKGIAI
jgi:hypothetical protein